MLHFGQILPRLRGDLGLLPGNGGVSVGTNLAIAQGDHKDRPYPRFLLYQGRKTAWGSQDDKPFAQQFQRTGMTRSGRKPPILSLKTLWKGSFKGLLPFPDLLCSKTNAGGVAGSFAKDSAGQAIKTIVVLLRPVTHIDPERLLDPYR